LRDVFGKVSPVSKFWSCRLIEAGCWVYWVEYDALAGVDNYEVRMRIYNTLNWHTKRYYEVRTICDAKPCTCRDRVTKFVETRIWDHEDPSR
jgi:hypothetical protein